MKINWKVRLKHKPFLVATFAAVLVLIQAVTEPMGLDLTLFNEVATNIFNAVLGLLVLWGIVVDPTTPGVEDSKRALGYNKPGEGLNEDGE